MLTLLFLVLPLVLLISVLSFVLRLFNPFRAVRRMGRGGFFGYSNGLGYDPYNRWNGFGGGYGPGYGAGLGFGRYGRCRHRHGFGGSGLFTVLGLLALDRLFGRRW